MREQHEREVDEVATFLNSVPLLNSLTREEKLRLLDGLEERTFRPGQRVITQASDPSHVGFPSPGKWPWRITGRYQVVYGLTVRVRHRTG